MGEERGRVRRAFRALTGPPPPPPPSPHLAPVKRAVFSPVPAPVPGGNNASAGSGVAILAAGRPASDYRPKVTRQGWLRRDEHHTGYGWDAKVDQWIREGPGFVGRAASAYPQALAAGAQLVVQETTSSSDSSAAWVDSTRDELWEVLRMWRGTTETQQDLLERALWFAEVFGRCWQALHKDPTTGRWSYSLHSHLATELDHDRGVAVFKSTPDAAEGHIGWDEHPIRLVDHLWIADKTWPDMPMSQFQRAVEPVETHVLASRSIARSLASRLAANGILWSEAKPGGVDWTERFAEWAAEAANAAVRDEFSPLDWESLAELAPFSMITESKPEMIDLGRDLTREFDVKADSLNEFCMAVDLPKSVVTGDSSEASRWAVYVLRDEAAQQLAAPRLARVASWITNFHLLPWLRHLGIDHDPAGVRVWFRLPEQRVDRTAEIVQYGPAIGLKRETMAAALGLDETALADLPPGVGDLEAVARLSGRGPLVDPEPPELGPGVREPREPDRPDLATEPLSAAPAPVPVGAHRAEIDSWDSLIPGGR